MKKAFIVHGWGGSPSANWFPWMKEELEKRNIEIEVLAMPNTNSPNLKEWLAFLHKKINQPSKEVFLIGHSLGGITILKYLESLRANERIGGIVLAAGFSRSINIPELENFFAEPLDYEKVKKSVNKVVLINSDNDRYVPLEEGRVMEEKLNGKLIILHNAYHINEGNGFFTFPTGLEELLKIIN